MNSIETTMWAMRDEQFYDFLKMKYSDRKKLSDIAEEKRKSAEKMKDDNPLYHRAQVSAEMASLRLDMAYIVDRNNQLEQYLATVEFLHQKVGVLEGAYGYLKMMLETCRLQSVTPPVKKDKSP